MVLKRQQIPKEELTSPQPSESGLPTSPAQLQTKPPMVTQVVEVVSDSDHHDEPMPNAPESQPIAQQEAPRSASSMKLPLDSRAVVTDEPLGVQQHKTEIQSAPVSDALVPAPSEKEVINELFQNESQVGYPEISEHKKNPLKGIVLWGIIVIIIAGALGGVILFFSQGSVTVSTVDVTSVVPTQVQQPPDISPSLQAATPTPQATLAKKDLSIQILNGGGTKGAAAKMKTLLEEKEYTVKDTGNTQEYTYEQTEIFVKPGKEGYLELLVSDLKAQYTVGKQEATLEDDVPYDARIIVGKQ